MINLKVVSPQKVIFEKEVEMAVLPGAEGDFAAMENHSPFISSLRPGQMAIMANNQLQESFFVSGGLVMLKDKTCEVLVDQISRWQLCRGGSDYHEPSTGHPWLLLWPL